MDILWMMGIVIVYVASNIFLVGLWKCCWNFNLWRFAEATWFSEPFKCGQPYCQTNHHVLFLILFYIFSSEFVRGSIVFLQTNLGLFQRNGQRWKEGPGTLSCLGMSWTRDMLSLKVFAGALLMALSTHCRVSWHCFIKASFIKVSWWPSDLMVANYNASHVHCMVTYPLVMTNSLLLKMAQSK